MEAKFTLEYADLGTLKGLSGILSSQGKFKGPLDYLEVEGETDTPDFALRTASHPIPLHTVYSAIVDGTNGDVILNKVTATFLRTTIVARGEVVDLSTHKGRTINLDAVSDKGRVEDLLRLTVKTDKPVMTGYERLKTKIYIPERDEDLIDRMSLDGQFAIGDIQFTNSEIQDRIDTFSHKAQRAESHNSCEGTHPGVERNWPDAAQQCEILEPYIWSGGRVARVGWNVRREYGRSGFSRQAADERENFSDCDW